MFSLPEKAEALQADKHQLDSELVTARDKLTQLLADYDALQDEVKQLRGQQEAVEQLRDHVEQQHQALTEGASDAERGVYSLIDLTYRVVLIYIGLCLSGKNQNTSQRASAGDIIVVLDGSIFLCGLWKCCWMNGQVIENAHQFKCCCMVKLDS